MLPLRPQTSCTATLRPALRALLLIGLVLVGCAIPIDDQPRVIDESALSEELLPAVPVEPTQIPVQFDSNPFLVYFIGAEGKLVPVEREMAIDSDAEDVIRMLLLGPTEAEQEDANFTTSLPADLAINSVTNSQAGTVVLDLLEDPLESLSTAEQRLAIAQIVFTVADLDAVDSFRLQVNGVGQSLPTDFDDANADEPVLRSGFPSLDPEVEEETG